MIKQQTTVWTIRAWEGPLHDYLRRCWERVKELTPEVIFKQVPSEGNNHAQNLNKIWELHRENGPDWMSQFCVITEEDFLPDPRAVKEGRWMVPPLFMIKPAMAVKFAQRVPTGAVMQFQFPGAWWMIFDLEQYSGPLNFEGARDPATELVDQVPGGVDLVRGVDDSLGSLGLEYPGIGTHLFWSRHYNDPPDKVVAGFKVGEIVERTKAAIKEWWRRIDASPEE